MVSAAPQLAPIGQVSQRKISSTLATHQIAPNTPHTAHHFRHVPQSRLSLSQTSAPLTLSGPSTRSKWPPNNIRATATTAQIASPTQPPLFTSFLSSTVPSQLPPSSSPTFAPARLTNYPTSSSRNLSSARAFRASRTLSEHQSSAEAHGMSAHRAAGAFRSLSHTTRASHLVSDRLSASVLALATTLPPRHDSSAHNPNDSDLRQPHNHRHHHHSHRRRRRTFSQPCMPPPSRVRPRTRRPLTFATPAFRSASTSSTPCMVCKPSANAADKSSHSHSHSPNKDLRLAQRAPHSRQSRSSFTGVATTAVVAVGLGVNVLPNHDPNDPVFMDFDTHSAQQPTVTTATSTTTATTTTTTSGTPAPDVVPQSSHISEDMPPADSDDGSQPAKDAFGDGAMSSSTITTSSEASSSSAESRGEAKSSDGQKGHASDPALTFRTGVMCIPHPEKADKGGEDAFFIQKNALGVFDGVGGWASIGVDAGLYSKELARLTANYVVNEGPAAIVEALKHATENNRAIGSSTACVVGLNGTQLIGVNVGDSGLIVIRDGAIVYRTTEQQHYFNCPFQIGTDSLDTVDVGGPIDVKLQHGDWIIMGTDGLWDNVFPSSIVDAVVSHISGVDAASPKKSTTSADNLSDGGSAASDCSPSGNAEEAQAIAQREAQSIAQRLAEVAVKVANDERGSSPFAVNAQNAGHLFLGGKVDDITIISALVVDPDSECCNAKTGLEDSRTANRNE